MRSTKNGVKMGITHKEEIGGTTGKYAQWSKIKGNFEAKARVFNTALPAAEADILGTDITPTDSPSYLRIYFVCAISGILRVARTVGGTTIDENLNAGVALTANAAYMFTVPWRTGDGIDFQYSATGGNILTLDVVEVSGVE